MYLKFLIKNPCILLICTIVPKDWEKILSSQLTLMESETAHVWRKK